MTLQSFIAALARYPSSDLPPSEPDGSTLTLHARNEDHARALALLGERVGLVATWNPESCTVSLTSAVAACPAPPRLAAAARPRLVVTSYQRSVPGANSSINSL